MASFDKRRQIERWALNVAACADSIDELTLSDASSPQRAERRAGDSEFLQKSYTTAAVKPTTSIRLSPPPRRKEPQVVRVALQASSSDDSIGELPYQKRQTASSRPYVVNTSGSSRSRRAYAESLESSIRRRRSPPRSAPSRRSPSPARSPPRYNIVRRALRPSVPPDPDMPVRYYVDERPRYYEVERPRRLEAPIRPSRPRPRSADPRDLYYTRSPSPEVRRMIMRSPSPKRVYYPRTYRDELPRRTISVRSRGDDRYADEMVADARADAAADRLNQLYDEVDRLRSSAPRMIYPEDEPMRRRRSFTIDDYDDYD